MTLQLILYSVVFVVTAGIAVMGSLLSFRLQKRNPSPLNQILIYQQLFSYTFLFYGIWSNLALINGLDGLQISDQIRNKIMSMHSLLGLPFLCVAWYMIIRIFYGFTGRKWKQALSWLYFAVCVLALPTMFFVTNLLGWVHDHYDMFTIYSVIAVINLAIHLLLFGQFVWNIHAISGVHGREFRMILFSYFAGVVLYSGGIWMIEGNHYIISLVTILIIFASNLLLPVVFSSDEKIHFVVAPEPFDSFESFCRKYDISKREAEIILEVHAGKSNQKIADTLFITLQTVKDHLHRIFTKTGVSNRVQLINLAGKTLIKGTGI